MQKATVFSIKADRIGVAQNGTYYAQADAGSLEVGAAFSMSSDWKGERIDRRTRQHYWVTSDCTITGVGAEFMGEDGRLKQRFYFDQVEVSREKI